MLPTNKEQTNAIVRISEQLAVNPWVAAVAARAHCAVEVVREPAAIKVPWVVE